MWKRAAVLSFLFIIGILFRVIMVNLSPQPFWFDQAEYQQFALGILQHGFFFVESSRTYGFPLLVAATYKVFGISPVIWQSINIILDTCTAFLVFAFTHRLARSSPASWSALIIALFNPFTAVYNGMLLSEPVSIFLTALILWQLAIFFEKPTLRHAIVPALLLGILPQVRPVFLYFDLAVLLFIIWKLWRIYKTILPGVLAFLLFSLWFIYPLIGNYRTFGVLSPTTADDIFPRELYISLKVTGPSPHPADSLDVFPAPVQRLYNEYSLPSTAVGKRNMAKKYLNMSLRLIQQDPIGFIRVRLAKSWYVWQKTYFYYFDRESNILQAVAYWLNIGLLSLWAIGVVILGKTRGRSPLYLASVSLIFFIAIVHSVTLAEERYSLPGYPVIFAFTGYAVSMLFREIYTSKLLRRMFGAT